MIFFRPATLDDIPAIKQVLVQSWHEAYDPIMGKDQVLDRIASTYSENQLIAKLDLPNTQFLVGGEGDQVVGMVFAAEENKCVAICELYVHPSFQRKNIGTYLLNEIATLFSFADYMVLEVLEKNTRAIAFYENNGFAKMGVSQERHDIEQGLISVLMQKPIRKFTD